LIHTLVRNDGGADILKNSIFRVRPRHNVAHRAYHFKIYEMPLIGWRISFSNVAKNKPGSFKYKKLHHTEWSPRFDVENDITISLYA